MINRKYRLMIIKQHLLADLGIVWVTADTASSQGTRHHTAQPSAPRKHQDVSLFIHISKREKQQSAEVCHLLFDD